MSTEHEQIVQRGFDAFETGVQAQRLDMRELPDGRVIALCTRTAGETDH